MSRLVEDITDLDLMVMRDRRHGGDAPLDRTDHRLAVSRALGTGEAITIRKGARLAAYALFVPREEGVWFTAGLARHPGLAGPGTLRRLRAGVDRFLRDRQAIRVESHVYRTNLASLALHRRLGFRVIRENESGYALSVDAARLLSALQT